MQVFSTKATMYTEEIRKPHFTTYFKMFVTFDIFEQNLQAKVMITKLADLFCYKKVFHQ